MDGKAKIERGGSRRGRPWVILASAGAAGLLFGGAMSWMGAGARGEMALPESMLEEAEERMLVARPSPRRRNTSTEAPTSIAGLPVYPGTHPQYMVDAAMAQDVPMALAWFTTRDEPEVVADWYQERLFEADLPVVADRLGPEGGYVGFRNKETGQMHVVTLMDIGGETMGLISAASAEKLMDVQSQVPDVIPHPPNAENTMVVSMVDGDQLQRSIYARVPGTISDLVDFYRRAFTEKGWRVQRVVADNVHQARIDARGDRHTVQVMMQEERRAVGNSVAVYVLLIGGA